MDGMGYVRYNTSTVDGRRRRGKKKGKNIKRGNQGRLTIRRVHTVSTVQLQDNGFYTFAGVDDDLGGGRGGPGEPAES
jgi:hypothetical protein